MGIKAAARYHFIPTGMVIIRKENSSIGGGGKKLEPFHNAGENIKYKTV